MMCPYVSIGPTLQVRLPMMALVRTPPFYSLPLY